MEKSSQIWKIVPLRHFFPLKVVPLIEVLLYWKNLPASQDSKGSLQIGNAWSASADECSRFSIFIFFAFYNYLE
jgi:hypothetical protein